MPCVSRAEVVLVLVTCGAVLSPVGQEPGGMAATPLRGADGPQAEIVGRPPHGNEIVEVFVYETSPQAAVGSVRPRRFPSGVRRLRLDLRLKQMPRTGVRVRYEIVTPEGPLPMAEGGLVTISFLTTIGVASMDFELVPREPPFPDGPYRLAVFMDEVAVAVLNWSVGAS